MSSWPNMTTDQVRALARFLATMRRDWDVPGIEHQLDAAREKASAPALAIAAIRAAASAHNRTPAVIPLDGEHWRAPTSTQLATPRPVPASELCQVCGKPEPTCRRIANAHPLDGHKFKRVGEPEFDEVTGELLAIDHSARREEIRQIMRDASLALAMPD